MEAKSNYLGPKVIASCHSPAFLGPLLQAVGSRYNCTSHLAIRARTEKEAAKKAGWVLEVDEAPYYTAEVAAFIRGWLEGSETHEVWFPE